MEQKDALAEAVGAHFEARAARRERVVAAQPRAAAVRDRRHGVVLTVVEDDLEHPIRARHIRLDQCRRPVAVPDSLRVLLRTAAGHGSIGLVRSREVDAGAVFRFVAVDNRVALVVEALADQPAEDARRIHRVGDAALGGPPVQRRDVLRRDRAPVGVGGSRALPAFDPGEQPFDARPVAPDPVCDALDCPVPCLWWADRNP